MREQTRTTIRRMSKLLRSFRWSLTALVIVATIALGWIGFDRSAAVLGRPTSITTNLYQTLQLFELHMGEVAEPIPWQLDMARFLAPALTLFAAATALFALLGGQLSAFRARRSSDHIVICGLGRLGAMAAKAFHAAGYRVVAIELDAASTAIEVCREDGIIVLIGDATDRSVLRLAAVQTAHYLLAVTGDDNANAKIAIDARQLVTAGSLSRPLSCFIHLKDGTLTGMLNELGISAGEDAPFRLEAFNASELAARTILDRYPAFDAAGMTAFGTPKLLVVGLGEMGARLIVDAALRWKWLAREGHPQLAIVVVDRDATQQVDALVERFPSLGSSCDITVHELDVSAPAFARAAFLFGADGSVDVTGVYISLSDDVAGLTAALALKRRMGLRHVPIVVGTTQEGGAAAFLGDDPSHPIHEDVTVFGILDLVSEPDVLLRGQNEVLARSIHAEYVRNLGAAAAEKASAVPWDALPDLLKESNRRQAADVGRKLRAIGRGVEPLLDWDAPTPEFTPTEIELMARMEHDRWNTEKMAEGWHLGPNRDVGRKETPYLVPYDVLPEDVKDYDRDAVRAIPNRLAEIGYAVRRVHAVTDDPRVGTPESGDSARDPARREGGGL